MRSETAVPDARRPSTDGGDRPDLPAALVTGWYAAAMTAPGALSAAAIGGVRDTGALYVGFVGCFAAVLAVTTLAVRRLRGFAVRLGATRLRWALPAAAGGYFLALPATARPGVPAVVAVLGVVAVVLAGLSGVALATMASTRYADHLLAGTDRGVEWQARHSRRARRLAAGFAGCLALLAGVGLLLDVVWGVTPAGSVWPLFPGTAGALVGYVYNRATYEVTGAGLLVAYPLAKRLIPYDTLAGYRVTDDALVLRRRSRWRSSIRCDSADIEDLDAVTAALDERLQRSGTVER